MKIEDLKKTDRGLSLNGTVTIDKKYVINELPKKYELFYVTDVTSFFDDNNTFGTNKDIKALSDALAKYTYSLINVVLDNSMGGIVQRMYDFINSNSCDKNQYTKISNFINDKGFRDKVLKENSTRLEQEFSDKVSKAIKNFCQLSSIQEEKVKEFIEQYDINEDDYDYDKLYQLIREANYDYDEAFTKLYE